MRSKVIQLGGGGAFSGGGAWGEMGRVMPFPVIKHLVCKLAAFWLSVDLFGTRVDSYSLLKTVLKQKAFSVLNISYFVILKGIKCC